jgi:immunity protein, SdpI family
MELNKFKFAIVIILIQIALSFYLGLPLADDAKVPSHWNLQGEVDGWTGKYQSIIMFPLINIVLFCLMFFFPSISPRYRNDPENFDKILPSSLNLLVFFFAAIHIFTILIARGYLPTENLFVFILLGLLFILVGNLLPKVPANFYLGVRVPWTLSSDVVWKKTSKITGKYFAIGGVIFIIIGVIGKITVIVKMLIILVLTLIIVLPILYSFSVYKKEQNS